MARIAVVLTEGFADWEYALIGGTGGPFYGLDVAYFAPQPGALHSQGGLSVQVDRGLDSLVEWDPDVAVVVGGMIWESDAAPEIGALLRSLHAGGAAVAGICGGTLALARAGLLDRVRHSSNAPEFLVAHGGAYAGAARYVDSAAAVTDGRVITAPGTAPASFTAAVFEAAGLGVRAVAQFRSMLAAEHATG